MNHKLAMWGTLKTCENCGKLCKKTNPGRQLQNKYRYFAVYCLIFRQLKNVILLTAWSIFASIN